MTSPLPIEARITGRSSSHFTRVARMCAHELGLPLGLDVVHDLASTDVRAHGGHPGLKMPTLHVEGTSIHGTENICRRLVGLAARAGGADTPRLVLAEQVESDLARNAQELAWCAMSAQVQLVAGTQLAKLPADSPYFVKARVGLEGALAWLEVHLAEARAALPTPRATSLLELTVFCLLEHVVFRPTVSLAPYPRLRAFVAEMSERPSARETAYRYDPRPDARG